MGLTKREKKRVIRELCADLERKLLGAVDKMPPEWDGVEIRRLAADKMHEANWSNHQLRGQTLRGRAYIQATLNLNL